jgi:effector-binding domain-containing protein
VITLPESTVAAVRLVLPTNDQAGKLIGQAFDQLFGQLHELKIEPTGPCLAMWYGSPDDVVSETLDAAVPVDAAEASHGDLRIIRHPEQTVATVTHRGPFSEFQTCHIILKEWMAMHAYRLSGPYREVYHTPPSDNAVTEVQYPIESIHV